MLVSLAARQEPCVTDRPFPVHTARSPMVSNNPPEVDFQDYLLKKSWLTTEVSGQFMSRAEPGPMRSRLEAGAG
jgi:hypothetical protein